MTIENVKSETINKIKKAFQKVAQPRSDYALKHFVVGAHETAERQYIQCVTELWYKAINIRRSEIMLKKKYKELELCGDDLDKELLSLDIEELKFGISGAVAEFETLYSIFLKLPDFSRSQLQESEEKYWILRLSRQAEIDIASSGRVSAGNLEALRQAHLTPNYDFPKSFLTRNPELSYLLEKTES